MKLIVVGTCRLRIWYWTRSVWLQAVVLKVLNAMIFVTIAPGFSVPKTHEVLPQFAADMNAAPGGVV